MDEDEGISDVELDIIACLDKTSVKRSKDWPCPSPRAKNIDALQISIRPLLLPGHINETSDEMYVHIIAYLFTLPHFIRLATHS